MLREAVIGPGLSRPIPGRRAGGSSVIGVEGSIGDAVVEGKTPDTGGLVGKALLVFALILTTFQ